jgi:hypothetical protein
VASADGGVHPGKLHAHGKLVETHRVTYSIGKVGEYELHIGLRQQAMPLPGSPFRLRVSPGVASALTTSVPPNTSMPLVGTVGLHEVRVSLYVHVVRVRRLQMLPRSSVRTVHAVHVACV